LGSPPYYIGNALTALGVETTIFGSFGTKGGWLKELKCKKLIHIKAKGTTKFINEYPYKENPNLRVQRAKICRNKISFSDFKNHNLRKFDYIIFCPTFHDDISTLLIEKIAKSGAKIILAPQGMIRYLDGDKIVWKKPEKAINALPHVDFLFLDETESKFITKIGDLFQASQILTEKGAKTIAITQGEKGSMIFSERKRYKIKAFPPKKLVDPTGTGDSYLAGFVKALELFGNPLGRGEFAAMTATLSIEKKGAFNKTTNEVLRRLSQN